MGDTQHSFTSSVDFKRMGLWVVPRKYSESIVPIQSNHDTSNKEVSK